MNARFAGAVTNAATQVPAGMLLGFGTVFRKEVMEWVRGRRALVVGLISLVGAALATVVSFIAAMIPEDEPPLSMDPTINVLLGWGGLTFQMVAVLATIGLLSGERDRGTLAWNLSNPVSPTSVLAAKWSAALVVYSIVGVLVPLVVSSAVATLVYGSLPNLATIALFAGLYLMVPAFYFALTIALGTMVMGTAGVAGIAFAVMFLPTLLGGLLPIINELSPTSMGVWAIATATGEPASWLTPLGWLAAMAGLAVGAKLRFDRQEF